MSSRSLERCVRASCLTSVNSKFLFVVSLCTVLASCSQSGGSGAVAPAPAPVAVAPPPPVASNAPPTIEGVPPKMAKVGINYTFTPTAADPDSDPLTFSITNQPDWTDFDSTTGKLAGVASAGSEGSYNDVVITVSDGAMSAALQAFSITVEAAAAVNMPPEISGTPPASVTAGDVYAFTPAASDPDGDLLTFSIGNKPAWASFNSATGTLTGIPSQSDVGVYDRIRIRVSDGQVTTVLPRFLINVSDIALGSVTLSWTPPTLNNDGSVLTDLAGYTIYFGLSAANYTNQISIDNPGISTFVVEGLVPNTYYFVATSINTSGAESGFSNETVKTVN